MKSTEFPAAKIQSNDLIKGPLRVSFHRLTKGLGAGNVIPIPDEVAASRERQGRLFDYVIAGERLSL
jgi:hypothetical protein